MERGVDGLCDAAVALGAGRRHNGHAPITQHGVDIAEVKVHGAVHADDVHNALHGGEQRVVGAAEGVGHGEVGIDVAQPLVVDDQQRVHLLGEGVHAVERLVDARHKFEEERNGHHADSEDAALACLAGNNRRRAGARAAAHASSDEDHLRLLVQHRAHGLDAFLAQLLALFRIAACAETRPELHAVGHGRVVEGFLVGVDDGVSHVHKALAVHVRHGVAAATAHADYLDNGGRVRVGKFNERHVKHGVGHGLFLVDE